jgi:deoxyribonuclease-4
MSLKREILIRERNMKEKELLIGAHKSIAGGVYNALKLGEDVGCRTIQIFTKNSNQWRGKDIPDADAKKFIEEVARTGISPVVAHDSYLINIASPNEELLKKSIDALFDELKRCELLEIPYLVMHPGSHTGSGEEVALKKVAESINTVHSMAKGFNVKILLETTAGQGTNLGYSFEHLRTIYDKVKQNDRLGYCYDTCHTFVAGYDITSREAYEETMQKFDKVLGIENLLCFHINDAKKGLGSRIDRHEHIGKGTLGELPFAMLMQDKRFKDIPKILETPKGKDQKEDVMNMKILKRLAKKKIK